MKEILDQIRQYVDDKNAAKTWTAGEDQVNYAGPLYDAEETVAAVETLLKGWLVLGNDCARFEHKFPAYFEMKFGVLTNSGSSANLLMMSALKSKRGHNLPVGTKVLTPIAGFPTTLNPMLQVGFAA